jgi:hypothetical protein
MAYTNSLDENDSSDVAAWERLIDAGDIWLPLVENDEGEDCGGGGEERGISSKWPKGFK